MELAQVNRFRRSGPAAFGSVAKASGRRFHIRKHPSRLNARQIFAGAGLVPARVFLLNQLPGVVNFGQLGYINHVTIVGSFDRDLHAFRGLGIP